MGAFENYFNPFPKFPLRLLWWIDEWLHNHNISNQCSKALCDYLDDRIWDGIDRDGFFIPDGYTEEPSRD